MGVKKNVPRKDHTCPSVSVGLSERELSVSVLKRVTQRAWVASEAASQKAGKELEEDCGVVLEMHWAGLQAVW